MMGYKVYYINCSDKSYWLSWSIIERVEMLVWWSELLYDEKQLGNVFGVCYKIKHVLEYV